jgi:hypothetical protein
VIRQVRKASRGQSPPESASAVTEMTTPDTARIQEVIEEPAAELDTIGPSDSTAAETPG